MGSKSSKFPLWSSLPLNIKQLICIHIVNYPSKQQVVVAIARYKSISKEFLQLYETFFIWKHFFPKLTSTPKCHEFFIHKTAPKFLSSFVYPWGKYLIRNGKEVYDNWYNLLQSSSRIIVYWNFLISVELPGHISVYCLDINNRIFHLENFVSINIYDGNQELIVHWRGSLVKGYISPEAIVKNDKLHLRKPISVQFPSYKAPYNYTITDKDDGYGYYVHKRDQQRLRSCCRQFHRDLKFTYVTTRYLNFCIENDNSHVNYLSQLSHLTEVPSSFNLKLTNYELFFKFMTNLTSLSFSGINNFTNRIALPATLTKLGAFCASDTPISISHLTKLTVLIITSDNIDSLPYSVVQLGIGIIENNNFNHFTNIRKLVIASQVDIHQLSHLSHLSQLTSLSIVNGTGMSTFDFNIFRELQYLEINNDESIRNIICMKKLKTLCVTKLQETDFINSLIDLTYLNVSRGKFPEIRNLTHLRKLVLESLENAIDIDKLLLLTNLRHIDIIECDLSRNNVNFSSMINLKHFTYSTSSQRGDVYFDVRNCKKLKIIMASEAHLIGVLCLSNLHHISGYKITNENISQLTSLREMDISVNEHIDDISHLTRLNTLIMEMECKLTYNSLINMKNLRYLNLNCNRSKYNLRYLNNLEVLHGKESGVSVGDIEHLTNLTSLHVNVNILQNINISCLRQLEDW